MYFVAYGYDLLKPISSVFVVVDTGIERLRKWTKQEPDTWFALVDRSDKKKPLVRAVGFDGYVHWTKPCQWCGGEIGITACPECRGWGGVRELGTIQ